MDSTAYKSDYSIYFFLLVTVMFERIFFEIEELLFFKKDIFFYNSLKIHSILYLKQLIFN